MAEPSQPTHAKRRKYVLDARWQYSVSAGVAGTALATGLLFFLGTYLLASGDPIESLSGTETAMLALTVNALYFLILAGLLFWVVLRITHAVVGPAMLLERAIDGLKEGRFDCRLSLRRGDYLKSLASSIQRLSIEIQKQQAERERLCGEIENAALHGDRDKLPKLLQELRAAAAPAQPVQPAQQRTAA
jgi:hypothetical protein